MKICIIFHCLLSIDCKVVFYEIFDNKRDSTTQFGEMKIWSKWMLRNMQLNIRKLLQRRCYCSHCKHKIYIFPFSIKYQIAFIVRRPHTWKIFCMTKHQVENLKFKFIYFVAIDSREFLMTWSASKPFSRDG